LRATLGIDNVVCRPAMSVVTTWIFSLSSVVGVSLVSLAGLATLSLDEARVRRLAVVLVSFAVGALLGDAFIHLTPEAFASDAPALRPSLLILAGMLIFFLVEKLLRHRHASFEDHADRIERPELATINLIGDGIHNFIDGALIGASYLISPTLGLSTTVAVLFHEIPQELGDFGILVHSGVPVRKAVLLNLASASIAILGTVVVLLAGTLAGRMVADMLVPVTAGGFTYIAAADLIPELQRDRSLRGLLTQGGPILLGIAVMALLTLAE
jgi:zinc and cadmium transporter